MADNYNNDELDTTTTDKEPATGHDVTTGGVIGAVGGAIVGGLAGGPVGAVIGAVAGGAASAGAVDVVDKHDHDYARTTSNTGADTTDDLAYNRDLDSPADRTMATPVAPYEAASYDTGSTTARSYDNLSDTDSTLNRSGMDRTDLDSEELDADDVDVRRTTNRSY